MGSPFEYGGNQDIFMPPVVASISVDTERICEGALAAYIVKASEKEPQPCTFLALTLN